MRKNKNYPYNQVTPFGSIRELLKIAVREAGDKIAFRHKENGKPYSVTYGAFYEDTMALGTALSSMGLDTKHVAVIGENSYKWVTVFLTMLQSNGVAVPVDKELPCEDIIHVLEHSDSKVLFYAKKYEKFLPRFLEALPQVQYFIGFGDVTESERVLSYDKFLDCGRAKLAAGDNTFRDMVTDVDALREIVYTSGTTGMAKGVMLRESNLVNIVYHGLRNTQIKTVCLSVLPLHHTFESGSLLFALHCHATICINENIKAVLKNLQLYKPDYIVVVPAFAELFYKKIWANAKESGKEKLLKAMIPVSDFLRFFGIDLRRKLFHSIHAAFGGNLEEIVCGGAPLRASLGKFFDSVGINLINGYGITECSPIISANRNYFNDPATVGVPIPCVSVRIENPSPEGDGEICVKGSTVMLGYYKDEAKTQEVIKDGWFYTGDYGRINKKGQLLITGRKKNLIVLKNGKNVFPEELEGYIMQIPYVAEVVVSAIRDEEQGEIGLMAEVYLNPEEAPKENAEKVLLADIHKVCAALPIYKTIGKVKIRDTDFLKTTTNKIKR